MKIYIDPGHGGADGGCVANGIEEKNVNLSVALKLKPLLIAAGLEVMLSREDDSFPDLMARPSQANAWGADRFISIHHNGGGGNGYEIYRSITGGNSLSMAQTIAAKYEAIGRSPHNGGVQTRQGSDGGDYYAVIHYSNMPAILSEFCYLDSSDVNAIVSDSAQQAEAQAIAEGIFAHLEISPSQTVTSAPQPAPITQPVVSHASGDPYTLSVQQKMNRLHITGDNGNALEEDGIFGECTRQAVNRFEMIAGITMDGAWGPQCECAYQNIVSKPEIAQGSTGQAVKYVQYRLGISFDGVFGADTLTHVKAFQTACGLDADGIIGPCSWAKLIG